LIWTDIIADNKAGEEDAPRRIPKSMTSHLAVARFMAMCISHPLYSSCEQLDLLFPLFWRLAPRVVVAASSSSPATVSKRRHLYVTTLKSLLHVSDKRFDAAWYSGVHDKFELNSFSSVGLVRFPKGIPPASGSNLTDKDGSCARCWVACAMSSKA
jgi:hypothetical protein